MTVGASVLNDFFPKVYLEKLASDRENPWTPAIGSVDSARSGGVLLFPLGTWRFLSIGTRVL